MTTDPSWLEGGLRHLWAPYAQMKTAPRPLAVRATQGCRLILDEGRALIDGVASWWTAVHGYNHPRLIEAARRQLDEMPHVMLGGLVHEQAARLAARLARMTLPGGRVFFSESGSVAVEVAMKIAVQYWRNSAGETRSRFVSFKGGYHGDTFATMSVCDPEEGMHALFAGVLPAQHVVDLCDLDGLRALLGREKNMAAVLVEPLIQGAGGMRVHEARTLRCLREICDEQGALLIFDEIFTGFGRTGAMFAANKAGVVPDIMTLGKALTGGVAPLAATVASARVYAAFHDDDPAKALMHGPTFSGYAVGCAVANASLDLFEEEPRLHEVAAIEAMLAAAFEPLRASKAVKDVRVLGAMGAVELAAPYDVEAARARFIERGVFIRPLGQVIYLTPAYVIGADELGLLTAAVSEEAARLSA
ncbi:MAG: adenosylmethionine--8-amino-7-oxononanoate transaminase [Parvularculaceae bacterium]|uniref:adenosylmethionine--8-amino-7-oxononanoate transaminase n=1 Tax=Methylocystis sp. TaxID=1911079 RepID=UPI003D095F3B